MWRIRIKRTSKSKSWIISTREELAAVIERTPTKYRENIKANESDSPYQEVEEEHSQYVTILTEYFRKNGAVYWQHTESGAITSRTPTGEEGEDVFSGKIFDVYPVVSFAWDRRDKSYLGIGEVEGLGT